MRLFLVLLSILTIGFGVPAFSEPTSTPSPTPTPSLLATVANDPCLDVIKSVVSQVETSSGSVYKLRSVTLLSATEERDYELRFDGLSGKYDLVLDNDSSNKCFLIQQKYIF